MRQTSVSYTHLKCNSSIDILEELMKYTRVKAVTCALTASAMLFSTAAMQTSASGVSYELPAAGVGLALDEGLSLIHI